MEIFSQYSFLNFMNALNDVKQSMREWMLVDITVCDEKLCNIMQAIKDLQAFFIEQDVCGCIFICDKSTVVILANVKNEETKGKIREHMTSLVGEKHCDIKVADASHDTIDSIQLRLQNISDQLIPVKLCPIRKARHENVIMVADDDIFMRALVVKSLSIYGRVVEVSKGTEIIDKYLEELPDILFLDIHMPDADGIDILKKLVELDRDSYIVMLSSDSNRNNVIDTNRIGAKGFVAKPFTAGKLLHFLEKCPTVSI